MTQYIEFYYGEDCLYLIKNVERNGGQWRIVEDAWELYPADLLTGFELFFINSHPEEFFDTLVGYLGEGST